ncbi:tyrosine-protein phosphatase [Paenibacillus harenae]|uniref:tyrosine-protein phosphatase n=1 Tax=Paenibacillus harenae TaxID=306543 RepID=UPI00279323BD|nr:tyrosine-protein phosphatase [Paenibacillus harenae]MDQ0061872.1 protein-tyrosine phosphatase [Paenibacillus harenae]
MTTQHLNHSNTRVLPFHGVLNFRDMGGYAAAGGRKVKRGMLFRSAELTGMTESDRELFASLGIKTVFDYRDDKEAELKPDPAFENIANVRIPAMNQPHNTGDIREMLKSDLFRNMSVETFADMYVQMAIDNASFKKLMSLLQEPDSLGLLHHCAAGRDRTGIGSAFILLALGVDRETIIEDYLISNVTLVSMNEKMKEQLAELLDEEQMERMKAMFQLRREFMEAVFGAIDAKYGDTDSFLEQQFGLTADKRAELQARCLE